MLNNFSFKILSIPELKFFCKNAGIKKYSTLKKRELFDEYNKYLACLVIQKRYRLHFYKNAEDNILLEKVSYPCFVYRTKHGKFFFYKHDTIIKYIMKSGDTRDPMTRNQYSDEELSRLDHQAKYYFPDIKYSSTLKIKKNINYAKRIRNRENEILSFQTQFIDLKSKIMYLIEFDAWVLPIDTEAIIIDSIEYNSMNGYINDLMGHLKAVYLNLKEFDLGSATGVKENMIDELSNLNNYSVDCVKKYIDLL